MLLADLELATEQACDEQAAARLGDRLLVARALLAVERLMTPAVVCPGVHRFGAAQLSARVEALLAPRLPAASLRAEHGGMVLAVVISLLLTDPLHHLAETIITLLVA
jgi:beta-lactamase regulating signal transducer with metallopeptidase domain